MKQAYEQISPSDRADYEELVSAVTDAVWPEFMHHDAISAHYWSGLFKEFPEYQFALVQKSDESIVGAANCIPLECNLPIEELPEDGFDWAIEKGFHDRASGSTPNLVCALQIAIAPAFQGRGLSALFVQRMCELVRARGFTTLIAPVRPNRKHRYPLSDIDSYLGWELANGLPYDPWLRVHVRLGGRIVKPCRSSMHIVGTVAEWEDWSGLTFFEDGSYPVDGGLVPVEIDFAGDTGTYVEPNVWIEHDLSQR